MDVSKKLLTYNDKQNIQFNVLTLYLQEGSTTSIKNFYFMLHSFLNVIIIFIARTKLHRNLFFSYSFKSNDKIIKNGNF